MPDRRHVVLNLGGEGERNPRDGEFVVNINLMRDLLRPAFASKLGKGQVAIRGSAGQLPIRDFAADTVVANRFPIQFGRLVDNWTVDHLASEVFRVLRTGGTVEFRCSSCDVQQLQAAFWDAGLRLERGFRRWDALWLHKASRQ